MTTPELIELVNALCVVESGWSGDVDGPQAWAHSAARSCIYTHVHRQRLQETCPAWRAIVRAQATAKATIKAQLKVGAMVMLKDGYNVKVPLTITSMHPLRGMTPWATTFRLSLKHIGAIVPTIPEMTR